MCALGQDLREVAVALVGDDDRGPGLGDQEVRAGDADVGGQELGAQHLRASASNCSGSARPRSGRRSPCALRKSCSTSFAVRWIAGAMMWEGRFAAQLNDVFAEVGLDRLDARRLQRVVEADLLGDHRLALGDALRAHGLAEVDDDLARFVGVLRVVDFAAARADLPLVGLEIKVEVGERVILDRAGAVAQRFELGQPRGRRRPPTDEIARERHRALQSGVGQRLMRVLLELGRGRDLAHRAASGLPSPIAGPSAIPARISAT